MRAAKNPRSGECRVDPCRRSPVARNGWLGVPPRRHCSAIRARLCNHVTGGYSVDAAINAIKRGAYDYLLQAGRFSRGSKERFDELRRCFSRSARKSATSNPNFSKICISRELIGESPAMLDVFELAKDGRPLIGQYVISRSHRLRQGTGRACPASTQPCFSGALRGL